MSLEVCYTMYVSMSLEICQTMFYIIRGMSDYVCFISLVVCQNLYESTCMSLEVCQTMYLCRWRYIRLCFYVIGGISDFVCIFVIGGMSDYAWFYIIGGMSDYVCFYVTGDMSKVCFLRHQTP